MSVFSQEDYLTVYPVIDRDGGVSDSEFILPAWQTKLQIEALGLVFLWLTLELTLDHEASKVCSKLRTVWAVQSLAQSIYKAHKAHSHLQGGWIQVQYSIAEVANYFSLNFFFTRLFFFCNNQKRDLTLPSRCVNENKDLDTWFLDHYKIPKGSRDSFIFYNQRSVWRVYFVMCMVNYWPKWYSRIF